MVGETLDRAGKLFTFIEGAGLAVLGTVAVLLAAGALGHPVTPDGALPWWGPVSRWGLVGVLSAVVAATVLLAVLWAAVVARGARTRAHPLLFKGDGAAAVLDPLTGGPCRGI